VNAYFVSIEKLWTRLAEMENEKRFNGAAYPVGMARFPFRLKGQGFFPVEMVCGDMTDISLRRAVRASVRMG